MSGLRTRRADRDPPGGAARLALVLALTAALGLLPLLLPDADTTGPLTVVVSVPPQAWLLRRLGGERLTVEVLLPPGTSAHSYELAPQRAARLAGCRLLVLVGHPDFPFEPRLLAGLPASAEREVVSMAELAPLTPRAGGEHDPHLWLSPAAMRATARAVSAALARLDPAGAAAYRAALPGVLAEIDGAAAAARVELAGLAGRRVLVYHPAWGHLLAELGLEQAAIEAEGKEPSPRRLGALIEQARRERTRAVFVQPGFADRPARAIAAEIGAEVVTLDPLAEDWPTNVRRAATRFRSALGG